MDIVVALVGLAIAVIVVAYIAQPLIVRTRVKTAAQESPRDKLLAERDALYTTIRDLDFDFQTGKLLEADYRVMREKYTARGVEILKELDALALIWQLQGSRPKVEASAMRSRPPCRRRRKAKRQAKLHAAEDEIEAAIRARRQSRIGDQPSAIGGHDCPSCGAPFDPLTDFAPSAARR